jgi:hypothetical protein
MAMNRTFGRSAAAAGWMTGMTSAIAVNAVREHRLRHGARADIQVTGIQRDSELA